MDLPSYISGFVDGEGCFCISFSPRKTLKAQWEIRPSFSVSQNNDRSEVLYEIQKYFKCGTIRPDRSDKTLKYEVRSINDLWLNIIPHFDQYPLLSQKQRSFEIFRMICEKVKFGLHKDPKIIVQCMEDTQFMNQGRRKYFSRKRWRYSLLPLETLGQQWSSDPHEWFNGVKTVSTWDSVKLQSR